MITINTQEKWLEFKFNDNPIKGTLNKVWLGLEVSNKNQVLIKFTFGNMVEYEETIPETETTEAQTVIKNKFVGQVSGLQKQLYKTNEEVENYNYLTLHNDALTILQDNCLTENVEFTI